MVHCLMIKKWQTINWFLSIKATKIFKFFFFCFRISGIKFDTIVCAYKSKFDTQCDIINFVSGVFFNQNRVREKQLANFD